MLRGEGKSAVGASMLDLLALLGSMALPWVIVTDGATVGASATSMTLYAWQTPTILLLPLLFLPAVSLVVSALRARRRGEPPTGDTLALAILGVVAVVVYAFLLALAASVALSMERATPETLGAVSLGAIAISAGSGLALAGSLIALAGVIVARGLARRPQPGAQPGAQSGG